MQNIIPSPYQQNSRNCRNSSVELFRILATFLVLIVHCNGWLVGGMPDKFNFEDVSLFRVGQLIIQSLTACCVNCFLVITGWYGVKFKLKTIWNINWLLICVYVPFYILNYIFTQHFSIYGLLGGFAGILRESYFIQCYLMLMFLSPILNCFIEKYGRSILPYVLCFWGIEIVAEIIGNKSLGIDSGYSVIHFVLMYLLARTASLYKDELLKITRKSWIIGYFICSLTICIMYILGIKWVWNYSNPIVMMSAFCLFMPFLYKIYFNKIINWIAGSTLAVYIMHTVRPFLTIIQKTDNYILCNYPYSLYLLSMGSIILIVFITCILCDKIRLQLFSTLSENLYNSIVNLYNNVRNWFLKIWYTKKQTL